MDKAKAKLEFQLENMEFKEYAAIGYANVAITYKFQAILSKEHAFNTSNDARNKNTTVLHCVNKTKQNPCKKSKSFESSPNSLGICTLRSQRGQHIGHQCNELRQKINIEIERYRFAQNFAIEIVDKFMEDWPNNRKKKLNLRNAFKAACDFKDGIFPAWNTVYTTTSMFAQEYKAHLEHQVSLKSIF